MRQDGDSTYPACIENWHNLTAIGELTALDRNLADDFAPMLDSGAADAIFDIAGLINAYRNEAGLNVHKCYGYLASPLVGQLIADSVRKTPWSADI